MGDICVACGLAHPLPVQRTWVDCQCAKALKSEVASLRDSAIRLECAEKELGELRAEVNVLEDVADREREKRKATERERDTHRNHASEVEREAASLRASAARAAEGVDWRARCEAAEAYIDALCASDRHAENAARAAWLALRTPAEIERAAERGMERMGWKPAPSTDPCPSCGGTGSIESGNALTTRMDVCWRCQGTGTVPPAPLTKENEAAVDGILREAGCKGPFVDVLQARWDAALACVSACRGAQVLIESWARSLGTDPCNRDNYCRLMDALAAFDATATSEEGR